MIRLFSFSLNGTMSPLVFKSPFQLPNGYTWDMSIRRLTNPRSLTKCPLRAQFVADARRYG